MSRPARDFVAAIGRKDWQVLSVKIYKLHKTYLWKIDLLGMIDKNEKYAYTEDEGEISS